MAYSTGTVAKLLNVSRETVRQWVLEFGDHMSEDANPPAGQYRKFSEDDVRICAYIAKARDIGTDTEQIHADLRAGSRAEPNTDVIVYPPLFTCITTNLEPSNFAV